MGFFKDKNKGVTEGYIFGCKSMLNRPMHFHFQSNFGANFWMMPISAFCWKEDYDQLSQDEEKRLSLDYLIDRKIDYLRH